MFPRSDLDALRRRGWVIAKPKLLLPNEDGTVAILLERWS
jgi:hypothetical protein